MSEKIYHAITDRFRCRMQFWAANREAAVVSSSWPIEGALGDGGVSGPRTPIMLGGVHDTEMAIAALPIRYRQAVKQFWLFEGQSLRWHGRHRGIHRETFEEWVIKGHELLKAEFAVRSANWKRWRHEARLSA